MSSSFHDSAIRGLSRLVIATLVIALPCGTAIGADVHVQPIFELRGEMNSNGNLDPVTDSASDSTGEVADLIALISIATPKGETSIRPVVKLQQYSNRKQVETVEGFLTLNSKYAGPRSEFGLFANYSHRDTYTAELANAEFDNLDPDDPTTPETGNNVIGKTRQRFDFRPSYSYELSERASVGGQLSYQSARYSGAATTELVDYDFAEASGLFGWAVSPRRRIAIGGYVNKFDAKDSEDEAKAYGVTFSLDQKWSETAGASLTVLYEKDDIVSSSAPFSQNNSGLGATLTNYWKGETSEWRVVAGRMFTPTGRGGKSTVDQLRVQYDRQLSERLKFKGAARYLQDEALNDVNSSGNYDYGRLDLSLYWLASQRWLIGGGYSYTYRDRVSELEAADDNRFYLAILYAGLGRDRR